MNSDVSGHDLHLVCFNTIYFLYCLVSYRVTKPSGMQPSMIRCLSQARTNGRVAAGRASGYKKMGEVMGVPLVRMGWRPSGLLVPLVGGVA